MKLWPLFVVGTVLCWGAYVPLIHHGQLGFGLRNNALRAFLFVGVAYFIMSLAVLGWMYLTKTEPLQLTGRGAAFSTLAGILGALGALGIVFAHMNGGRPIVVAPVVFAGAPVVNTMVSMAWHKPASPPSTMFYVGIALAAVGASLVLRFKPV